MSRTKVEKLPKDARVVHIHEAGEKADLYLRADQVKSVREAQVLEVRVVGGMTRRVFTFVRVPLAKKVDAFKQARTQRVITIVYQEEGKALRYGACVFRKDTPKEQWDRKAHLATAVERFLDGPVLLTEEQAAPYFEAEDWREKRQVLREFLFTHRTHGQQPLSEYDEIPF